MVLNLMNLKKFVPGVLAAGAALIATSANAQSLTAPSSLATPTTAVGVATATGQAASSFTGLNILLPTAGNSIGFQISSPTMLAFTNLPATGNATTPGLNLTLNLTTITPASAPVLNFPSASYAFNADAFDQFSPFNAGTAVNINPGGPQVFNLGAINYTVTLNSASSFAEGTPTTINISTITGTIAARDTSEQTNGPEPGTFVLVGLGIAGLVARRRKN